VDTGQSLKEAESGKRKREKKVSDETRSIICATWGTTALGLLHHRSTITKPKCKDQSSGILIIRNHHDRDVPTEAHTVSLSQFQWVEVHSPLRKHSRIEPINTNTGGLRNPLQNAI
jgi:hypothetical protein